MGRKRIPSVKKFWSNTKTGPECWSWLGSFDRDGYPLFWDGDNQKMMRGHQYSYELHFGPRDGKCVMHICDNPSCINPEHLRLGTQKENQADKVAKNRQAKGEAQGASKLTEADVLQIRSRKSESYAKLSQEFCVAPSTIYRIWNNKYWQHLNANAR